MKEDPVEIAIREVALLILESKDWEYWLDDLTEVAREGLRVLLEAESIGAFPDYYLAGKKMHEKLSEVLLRLGELRVQFVTSDHWIDE